MLRKRNTAEYSLVGKEVVVKSKEHMRNYLKFKANRVMAVKKRVARKDNLQVCSFLTTILGR